MSNVTVPVHLHQRALQPVRPKASQIGKGEVVGLAGHVKVLHRCPLRRRRHKLLLLLINLVLLLLLLLLRRRLRLLWMKGHVVAVDETGRHMRLMTGVGTAWAVAEDGRIVRTGLVGGRQLVLLELSLLLLLLRMLLMLLLVLRMVLKR